MVLAGALSSMTNTILVMGSIYFLFGNDYASATNKAFTNLPQIIIYIIGTQGVLEAIVSAILCFGIGSVLLKVLDK